MRTRNPDLFLILLLFLLCLALPALSETARVLTPGGALNMRKAADAKSGLAGEIPNRSLVEVEETGSVWCKVVYGKKTGYVKTEFLKLPSQLPGKTVYPDGGALPLRAAPDAAAPVIAATNGAEPVTVESLAGDWAQVRLGEETGFVPVEALSYQYETAQADPAWIREPGMTVAACALLAAPEDEAASLAELAAGQAVTVTAIENGHCLAQTDAGWGYLPASALSLTGPADTSDAVEGMAPLEAAGLAQTALKKQFKSFAKQSTYCLTAVLAEKDGLAGPLYHCGFFNEKKQYLYGALVDAQTGKTIFTAAYDGFAAPRSAASLLPEGQVAVALSAETLAVGDVVDISVSAWTEHQCQYTLYLEEAQIAACEPGPHFTAAYRARKPGEYRLTVTVTDENGLAASADAFFTVNGDLPQANPFQPVYSQKDGWWLDKAYRKSSLDQSGCAIFALSSALQQLGYTGEEILPDRLAKTFALCLTTEGTNNERLVREAGDAFGYTYKSQLTRKEAWIVEKLRAGAVFSFSVARGHIALVAGVSEDGAMARILDSAPTATFTRIVNDSLFYQMKNGAYRAALSLDDIPGARWYFETDHYGGLEYWLRISYVANRGVRLIEPKE